MKTKKHGLARGLALTLAVFAALFGGAVAECAVALKLHFQPVKSQIFSA